MFGDGALTISETALLYEGQKRSQDRHIFLVQSDSLEPRSVVSVCHNLL